MSKQLTAILSILLALSFSASAQVFLFENHTNKDDVTSVESFAGFIWATTTGGVVRVDPSSGEVRTFLNSDGLGSIRINFAAFADDETAYFGSADGILSRCNLSNQTFSPTQLHGRDGTVLSLNAADTSAGFLWIATNVGLIKYDRFRNGGEVKETYRTLGSFQTEAVVNDVVVLNGQIFAGTNAGIAYADIDNEFLLDPGEWNNAILGADGIDDIKATSLGIQSGVLFVGTDRGLYVWDGANLVKAQQFGDGQIFDLKHDATTPGLYALRQNQGAREITRVDLGTTVSTGLESGVLATLGSIAFAGDWFLGSESAGLYRANGASTAEKIIVPGPSSNNLVGGGYSGDDLYVVARDAPVSILRNNEWQTLNVSSSEKLAAIVDRSGNLWVATFGDGAYRVFADGSSQRFSGVNSPLVGIAQNPFVCVINSLYEDVAGRIWFSLFQGDPFRPMVVFQPSDSTWGYFDAGDGLISGDNQVIAGGDGTAAIGANDQGIAFLRYGADPFNHSDDDLGYFSRSRRLPSAIVSALAYDRDNRLWVGTIQGLAYFDDEIEFFTGQELPLGVGSNITAIASDTRNNLWVGTTEGLAFLGAGNTDPVAFNTMNSELVSDEIEGLVYDDAKNQLLVFTRGGLSIIDYDPARQNGNSEVYAYPNPFRIGSTLEDILQFRIGQRGDIRIFTVAADLVRETTVNDGWDGRNHAGEFVATGVYVWELRAEDGSRYTGKVLVVRH